MASTSVSEVFLCGDLEVVVALLCGLKVNCVLVCNCFGRGKVMILFINYIVMVENIDVVVCVEDAAVVRSKF